MLVITILLWQQKTKIIVTQYPPNPIEKAAHGAHGRLVSVHNSLMGGESTILVSSLQYIKLAVVKLAQAGALYTVVPHVMYNPVDVSWTSLRIVSLVLMKIRTMPPE